MEKEFYKDTNGEYIYKKKFTVNKNETMPPKPIKYTWTNIELEKIYKNNIRLMCNYSLELESYSDDNNDNEIYKNKVFEEDRQFFKLKKERNLTEQEQVNATNEIVRKYKNLINQLGKDNFTFYDNGEIAYIWKNFRNKQEGK